MLWRPVAVSDHSKRSSPLFANSTVAEKSKDAGLWISEGRERMWRNSSEAWRMTDMGVMIPVISYNMLLADGLAAWSQSTPGYASGLWAVENIYILYYIYIYIYYIYILYIYIYIIYIYIYSHYNHNYWFKAMECSIVICPVQGVAMLDHSKEWRDCCPVVSFHTRRTWKCPLVI